MTRLRVVSRLPFRWPRPRGALLQGNVGINGGSLMAKVFLFHTRADMRAFWRRRLGQGLGRNTLASVSALKTWRADVPPEGYEHFERRWIDVDARYFCVMAFTERNLTAQIVAHECVHAAFAYAARRARSWWDKAALDNDEEAVAYPAGLLTEGVIGLLADSGYAVRSR